MAKSDVTITNRRGLSARPAALLSQTASQYECDIWIESNRRRTDAKNMTGVMMLGARAGTTVTVETQGEDAEQALHGVLKLIKRKFSEKD